MVVAFVESIKYVGHLFPVAFLRVFIGYYYINLAMMGIHGAMLTQPYLAEAVRGVLPQSTAPVWYNLFLESVVIPNWQIFSYVFVGAMILIGTSYVIGYLVRPIALLGIFLELNYMLALGGQFGQIQLSQTTLMMVIHFTLGWLGAGRCLGLDYFFYKRRRGLWW